MSVLERGERELGEKRAPSGKRQVDWRAQCSSSTGDQGREVRPYAEDLEETEAKEPASRQERKSTDSRWNILMARKRATAAYKQVETKMMAMKFQW